MNLVCHVDYLIVPESDSNMHGLAEYLDKSFKTILPGGNSCSAANLRLSETWRRKSH